MDWVREQGLERPLDLCFAFCTYQEAELAGGVQVAELWKDCQKWQGAIPSSWEIVIRAARKEEERQPKLSTVARAFLTRRTKKGHAAWEP